MAAPAAQPPSGAVPLGPGVPSPFLDEKRAFEDSSLPAVSAQPSQSLFGFFDPFVKPLTNAIASIQQLRNSLDLPNPGSSEAFEREVKSVHPANFLIEGARAELTKGLSVNPVFQVTHAFSMGAQSAPNSYNFNAVFGDEKNLFVAGVDDGLNVNVKAHHGWVPGHTTKVQASLGNQAGQTFAQIDHDYQGSDHSALIRAINPSPADGSGIYMVNYLQSLTRNFAFGLETVYQRPSGDLEDVSTSYVAKLTGDRDWSALFRLRPQGAAEAMYLHKLSDQVDFAADLQAVAVGAKRDAQATLGARYAFRMAVLRASIDTTGKISSVYETRLSPAFGVTFSGEIDHLQGQSKFGFGISIESGGEMDPNAPPPAPPSVPV